MHDLFVPYNMQTRLADECSGEKTSKKKAIQNRDAVHMGWTFLVHMACTKQHIDACLPAVRPHTIQGLSITFLNFHPHGAELLIDGPIQLVCGKIC